MSADLEIGQTRDDFFPRDPEESIRRSGEGEYSAALEAFVDEFSQSSLDMPAGEAPTMPLATPTPRDGAPFKLDRLIAEGGHGEIWQAVQVSLDRKIAVKQVKPRLYESRDSSQSHAIERAFYKEALVAAQLDHPTIVPVYDMTVDEKRRPMIAMKLVEGSVWTQLILQDQKMDPAEFLAKHIGILISVSHAVAFAHSRGVIHRDLKPSQVIVGKFGEVFLMDWGLAVSFGEKPADRRVGSAAGYAESANPSNSPAGTVCYMAPEQTDATGARLGPWTDVYLLGGILYYMLTGTRPHPQRDSAEAFAHAASGVMDPPEERAPERYIPLELSRLCMRALEGDPRDRHASVQDFIKDLESYLSGASGRAESVQIAAQVREGLRAGELDYRDYSEADRMLSRALVLWPESDEATRLQHDLIARYAEAALSNGDLGLSRVQALRLAPDERRPLIARIDSAHRKAARHLTQRRLAIVSAFVFLLVIGGLADIWITRSSRARVREQELVKKRADAQLQASLAGMQKADAEQKADYARAITDLRHGESKLAADLARLWRDEFPYPVTFRYSPYDRDFWASRDHGAIRQILSQRESYQGVRAGLAAKGIPLPPEPFDLPYYAAKALLYGAGPEGSAMPAYELFGAALAASPEKYPALLGMAVAAGREGEHTSASEHVQQAAEVSIRQRGFRGDYQKLLTLHNELNSMRWASFAFGPEDILVEARPAGQSPHAYEEESGRWQDGDRPAEWARSSAAGMGIQTGRGCRKIITYAPYDSVDTVTKSLARFTPQIANRSRYHVYATWAMAANAYPVNYVVKHTGGASTVTVYQNGWGGLTGNANRWVPLGEYEFSPGVGHCIEVTIDEDVQPVTANWGGQVVADAVVLTRREIPLEMQAAPIPEVDRTRIVHWIHTWERAAREAEATQKPILIFFHCPGDMPSSFCEIDILSRPEIAAEIASSFVPLRVHPHGPGELSWRFRTSGPGTLAVTGSSGTEVKPIPTEVVVSPSVLLSTLNEVRGDAR
jgi:serine/threonine protein kinase